MKGAEHIEKHGKTPAEVSAHIRGRPWAQTHSGRAVPLVDPEPSDIYWPDVCWGLAYVNRYSGHAGSISVAQHSLMVELMVQEPEAKPYALLHDAHEFVLNDIPTPAARAIAYFGGDGVKEGIKRVKADLDRAIFGAAGLPYPMPEHVAKIVHEADQRVMMTEVACLMKVPPMSWGIPYEPYLAKINAWKDPQTAYFAFSKALYDMLGLTSRRM